MKNNKKRIIAFAAVLSMLTGMIPAVNAVNTEGNSVSMLAEMPDNAETTKYSFASDMLHTGGAANNGEVYEWKVTSSPQYFYVGDIDFDALYEITVRWGYRNNSAALKFYAYDAGGEKITEEGLKAIAANPTALGEPIASMITSKKGEWGYSSGKIDKDGVSLTEGESLYELGDSAKLSVPENTGTKAFIIELSGDINEWAYFDNIGITTLDKNEYCCYNSINASKTGATSVFGMKFNHTDKAFDGYMAMYNSNGALIDVKKTQISEKGEKELTMAIPNDEKYTFKSFIWEGSEPTGDVVERTVNETAHFADTRNVNLTKGSLFENSEETGMEYVKSIDVDRLLAPSYEMHNLTAPNGKQRYGGWERKRANNWTSSGGAESFTLAGHSLGHWMSAAAVMYNDTGDTEILDMLKYAVIKLDELQTQTGSAYIGGCPEATFTNCFAGNSKWADNYWVPWYGIHKIYQGLADAYLYGDEETSKTAFKVLKKLADWAADGTAGLSDEFMQSMLNVEYGGMNEIFALMYEFTGEEKYLETARRFTHDSILNPLIADTDSLSGLHANTQIPKIIGAAELYEQDTQKYADYRKASENFWNYVVNNRSYAIGGNSIAEHFEAQGMESLGVKTCESCNTYNMMRLTEHLFSWKQDSAYMDWYEDALFNHILGQQEPETGAKMYFVSLLPGHHRVYEEKDNSWWCCTGTGMENPGRYTRVTYFENEDNLYVNLYMANEYEWTKKGLKLVTETDYPTESTVKISVEEGNAKANIKLRVPSWCDGMTAEAGSEIYKPDGSGYITISREWAKGDTININIPMSVRTYYSRVDNQIAYKYGPLTLAAPLGSCVGASGVSEYISNETKIDSVTEDVPYIITDGKAPESFVEKSKTEPLTFTIPAQNSSTGKEITLKPFYGVHHEFYTVYFNKDSEADQFEKALNDVTIDKVEPDGQQDELGHGMETNTSGSIHRGSFTGGSKNLMYRDAWGAVDSGSDELPYFSYNMSVNSGKNYLAVAVWGSDGPFSNGGTTYTREYDILVDGTRIGEATVNNDKPNEVMYNFYEIPEELTSGKESVTVKLRAKEQNNCACMLELRTTSEIVSE